ncbi:MAG: diguanylate cyclase [Ectothiorhodospiraceae bacterium]|jgi:diguanylate cyclase (GGDEF)-like protein|nr:diguanylate cyclase [Ectothiorhodospiraceae bacterium]
MTAIPVHPLLLPIVTGLGYFLGAKLGVWASAMSEGISIFWPPNSVLLAALLLTRPKYWPLHLLAVIPAEIIADLPVFTLPQALNFAFVNIIEVTLAAVLLRRVADPFTLDRLRNVAYFGLIAMFLASAGAALLGAWVYLMTTDSDTSYWGFWQIWWFGDGLGLLIFTPLLLSWLGRLQVPATSRVIEAGLLFLMTLGLCMFSFSAEPYQVRGLPHLPLLLLPLPIWAAIRFGLRGASSIGLTIALVAIYHMQRGVGPFMGENPAEGVLRVQEYLFVVVFTSLAIAALLQELRDRNALLETSQGALRLAQRELTSANLELEHKVRERTRELNEVNVRLERQALTDVLTGIANRRHFMAQAEVEVARAHRHDRPLSLLMFDIDHFKNINDEFGHANGDRVLVAVTQALHDTLRSGDLLARIGGEEFAVLLPDTDIDRAVDLAERLRQVVEATEVACDTRSIRVTISGGVAALCEADSNVEPILKRADDALYRSKANGRNRIARG